MKIAIIGGTGKIGKGLALRWGQKHQIIIGSREQEKARTRAAEYVRILKDHGYEADITGEVNIKAASEADVVVLAIRYAQISSMIEQTKKALVNKVIISVVVPMEKDQCVIVPDAKTLQIMSDSREDYKADYFCYVNPPAGSAAEEIASLLPAGTELVSAFHNVPAAKLANIEMELDYDIGVCGNSMSSKNIVFGLINDIPGVRPLDVGPLETSCMMESITPLLVNIAIRNNMKDVGVKFIN